jgi:hypothetical protein
LVRSPKQTRRPPGIWPQAAAERPACGQAVANATHSAWSRDQMPRKRLPLLACRSRWRRNCPPRSTLRTAQDKLCIPRVELQSF